ncbi:MAG TPA: aldo/keto reductase [Deinococcales bacterium]|nr:aldo/keto reductase [Deinococcales bacterium]
MEERDFGKTGLRVSVLGLGAAQVGGNEVSEDQAERLLNRTLDLGITLIDTARGYGHSEERVGRYLKDRRDEFVLSSKGGYGVDGLPDWTGETITRGIDAALKRLQTDRIDVMHLHSCPQGVLEQGEVIDALERAVREGKIRVAAYSGDAAPLRWAIESGRFGSIETSVNVFDQQGIENALPLARERGLGVIAKRPLGNVPWQFSTRPEGKYALAYWDRMKAMGADLEAARGGLDWAELCLRFTAYTPGVHSLITGTANPEHLTRNAELVAKGPLPEDQVRALRAAFAKHDQGWVGQE